MKTFRKPLLLLLMLAFIGQGLFASAAPCQMVPANEAGSDNTSMTAMDHSGHDMSTMTVASADSAGGGSCCDAGMCSMSHCQTFAVLPLSQFNGNSNYAAGYPALAGPSAPLNPSDSLYRPPITR